MSTHDEPPAGPPSRLTLHLGLLGLDDQPLPEAALAVERRALEAAAPRRLVFPPPAERPLWRRPLVWAGAGAGAGLAVAAALTLVLQQRPPPAFQMMGSGGVRVLVEQKGDVRPWRPGVELDAAARIAAEVQADGPVTAFWGVASRDHRLLSEPAWIYEHRLTLAAAASAAFPGSLQLDAVSEGETLCVVVCPQAALAGAPADRQTQLVAELIGTGAEPTGALAGCRASRFPLRR